MERVVIIAEAGVNHNGELELALELVDRAAEAGADYVKFQTFKAENLVTEDAKTAEYQNQNTGETSQFEMLKKLELSENEHQEIMNRCQEKGIKFLSTPFDQESAHYLSDKVDFFKVPSGEITNHPFLEQLASYGKPIVVSTGMSELEEVRAAIQVVKTVWDGNFPLPLENGLPPLSVLQCTTAYPCPDKFANLRAIQTMMDDLGLPIGFSDHTSGIVAGVASVAMGAIVVEKHFTLDRNLPGPDHKASLEPLELKEFVESLHRVSNMKGDGVKTPQEVEKKNILPARKGLRYMNSMSKGDQISLGNLKIVRPCEGMGPDKLKLVLGSTLSKDVFAGSPVLAEDLEQR